jgi:hypothetical protein
VAGLTVFGGSGINDANTGGLVIVTGVLVAVSLFLAEDGWRRLLPVLAGPILLNALIATESRSGFLALLVGGGVYAILANRRARKWMMVIGVGGLVLLAALSNAAYWGRIGTITHFGEQVEGLDTGHKRLILMEAQLQMAQGRPFGCGSRCTDILSPRYLDEKQLTGKVGQTKTRSSHNTMMTMLVDHGWLGSCCISCLSYGRFARFAPCSWRIEAERPVSSGSTSPRLRVHWSPYSWPISLCRCPNWSPVSGLRPC